MTESWCILSKVQCVLMPPLEEEVKQKEEMTEVSSVTIRISRRGNPLVREANIPTILRTQSCTDENDTGNSAEIWEMQTRVGSFPSLR